MKTLRVFLIFIISAASLTAADLSTPRNGNLYTGKIFLISKAQVRIYERGSFNSKAGVEYSGGRLYAEGWRGISIPSGISFTEGTDAVDVGEGSTLVLTGNSSIYGHGILGDRIEATGFAVLKKGKSVSSFALSGGRVFETLRGTIADIASEYSGKEIILTVSSAASGSEIALFTAGGRYLGSSPAVGKGYRWIHLLAAAPFGPGGETEIAAVKTPHIGGILEFYRWDGKSLVLTASHRGFSTHRIGSDNLNMAVAADFDGDGRAELLLPSGDFKSLMLVKRVDGGIKVLKTISLQGRLSTNILLVGNSLWFGTEDGRIFRYHAP